MVAAIERNDEPGAIALLTSVPAPEEVLNARGRRLPLGAAVATGQVRLVEQLLAMGAKTTGVDKRGTPAIHEGAISAFALGTLP